MFNICLECVKLFNIAVHNYDVFRFKFVHIHYTDKLYCLKLIKVKLRHHKSNLKSIGEMILKISHSQAYIFFKVQWQPSYF